jgi:hypothetical protein
VTVEKVRAPAEVEERGSNERVTGKHEPGSNRGVQTLCEREGRVGYKRFVE